MASPWPARPGPGLNGARAADFGMAASISIACADQAEVDRLWAAPTTDGGAEIMCGWPHDRGPRRIVPEVVPRLLRDPDSTIVAPAFGAMQEMVKLDVAALERAVAG